MAGISEHRTALIAKLSEHVKKKHNVQMMTSTIANWVRTNQSGN